MDVVIIGSHRSGTTAVARVFDRLGFHMGHRRDRNEESIAHVRANDEILRLAGGTWSTPEPLTDIDREPAFRDLVATYLEAYWSSPRARLEYLGPAAARPGRDLRPGTPTGWKDPRASLTWASWLRWRPSTQFVHVVRHGVDVAASLVTRAERALARRAVRRAHPLAPPRAEWAGGVATLDVERALGLWATYVRSARRAADAADYVELRYEDLVVAEPAAVAALAGAVGRPSPAVAAVLDDVLVRHRRHAHRDDEALTAVARRHAGLLEELGYGPG